MARPFVLTTAETLGRLALHRRGVRSEWFATRGGHIHCYDARGQGSFAPTVLLHGLGTAATAFAPLIRYLLPHVERVVAPDHLGHGFSARHYDPLTPEHVSSALSDTLLTALDKPAVVVGNSMGGALALKFASEHPTKVRALVLVSPAGAPFEEDDWHELTACFRPRDRAAATSLFRRIYPTQPWFLHLVAHEMPGHFGSPALCSLLQSSPESVLVTPEELQRVRVPILLLWGHGDHLLPRSHLAYFKRHLPSHAVIEEPPTFGHSPHVDATAALGTRIVEFLRWCNAGGERSF